MRTVLALGLLLLGHGAVVAQPRPTTRATGLRADLDWLCAPERKGRRFSPGLEVPRWIASRFRRAGLLPLFGSSYLQPFRRFRLRGVNVGGVLPGRGWPKDRSHVIVSAHHDHLGLRRGRMHPGASDNAAGVAAMLHIMRTLSKRPREMRHSVVFLAFDLEELGLIGSRTYCLKPALALDEAMAFTTMDILGRELLDLGGSRLVVLGAERATSLATLAADACPEQLELFFVGTDAIGDRSDYAAFRDRGVPYLFFTTGENRDYHKPTDTVERLDLPLLRLQAGYVGAVVQRLADLEKRPAFHEEPVTHELERRSFARLLADLAAHSPGSPLQRKAREILEGLEREKLAPRDMPRARFKSLTRHLMLALRRNWRAARPSDHK